MGCDVFSISPDALESPRVAKFFCAAIVFFASARLSAIASFMLIAGTLEGVARSGSFARNRAGGLGEDFVLGRSENGACAEGSDNGFAAVDIVRGRTREVFLNRGVEGDGAGRGEGSISGAIG
jgi:hypothetical protein